MERPDDIPESVWATAAKMAREYREWAERGNTTASLSDHATEALADTIARAIISADDLGWRPIETAPKDGSRFDVWYPQREAPFASPARRETDVFYDEGEDAFCTIGYYSTEADPIPLSPRPTHWMPLPAAPAKE